VKSEAEVEGRPALVIADADREAIADLVADMLIALLEAPPHEEARAGGNPAGRRENDSAYDDSTRS
jgi:hypothetical protein